MSPEEIQEAPYNFTYLKIKLGISNNEHHSYSGTIEQFKLINVPVMGIFINIPEYVEPSVENAEFIEPFSYDSPKLQFKEKDCPNATHVIITNDFENDSYSSDIFLQQLAHSELNQKLSKPAKDPFE